MRILVVPIVRQGWHARRRWLSGAMVLAIVVSAAGWGLSGGALGDEKAARAGGAGVEAKGRAVGYLRDVRPILAQHCFQCHGPDEATRKGKIRLDLKDEALARRSGKPAIAPGDLKGSLAWERINADDEDERMPPKGKAEPLTPGQVATLRSWIEQGARWEDHWSFQPPRKPPIPAVTDKRWVRDPLDAFVLSRLEREHLKPEAEASREAWLRRVSFDLNGLPPTPAELDAFLKDRRADAYETQVDRLLKSPRYGERQAQEWLDLARYADTSGYQLDIHREIWKWREWVVNACNANMPFDRFAVEQLAGDLLPNATLAQKVATGFNRNHPTNSEAGEEEDEYRSAYVIDRVNTTATAFMGLTLACAQCHDHKYDPFTQRDYYSFYAFFNNIKERDNDFVLPRSTMPVPSPDQAPRLADLKARINALKSRLERDDSLMDRAQREWERAALARLGPPVEWTTPPLAGLLSRGGSQLKPLPDGSILSTGPAPVKDTYDIMVLPGKKRITAMRLEVLPDDSMSQKALGRASDGRFVLSAIEIRNTTVSESQEPPLVYIARAEADINQKPREDFIPFDMIPGPIESAIVVEPVGSPGSGGGSFGWSIIDDERKRPHEAIFLPLEPLETNEASVLRVSLHQASPMKFKSLIGRFRITYTQDDRIRERMLPAQPKLWSSIGPFPAPDVASAYKTAFEPEKDINDEPLDLKKSYTKVVLPPPNQPGAAKPASDKKPVKKETPPPDKGTGEAKKDARPAGEGQVAKDKDAKPAKPGPEAKKDAKPEAKPEAAKTEAKEPARSAPAKPRPEKITWAEQRVWRDGAPAQLGGANVAYYLTRKVVSTRPRTATVQIAGPAGFRMWINGELAQTSAPPPPAASARGAAGPAVAPKAAKAGDDKDEPPLPEIDDETLDGMKGRGRGMPEKSFRIGLRQG